MAPTICMQDMPTQGADAPCRRLRHKNGISRHSRVEFKYSGVHLKQSDSNNSENWNSNDDNDNNNNNWSYNVDSYIARFKLPNNQNEECRNIIMKRRRGLLEIAARTIALIHRNNIFQQKVDALRYETQDYYIKPPIYKKDKKNKNFDDENIRSNSPSNQVPSSTYIYSNSDSDNDSTSDHDTSDESDR